MIYFIKLTGVCYLGFLIFYNIGHKTCFVFVYLHLAILCKICIIDYHQGFEISTIYTNNNCTVDTLKIKKSAFQYFRIQEITVSHILSHINHKIFLLLYSNFTLFIMSFFFNLEVFKLINK